MNQLTGIFRYVTFGLRKEWIDLFFEIKTKVLEHPSLGNRQQDAFYSYLQDAGLIVDRYETSEFCEKVDVLKKSGKLNTELLWSFLWINLCFNASLFLWWANLDCGEYSREETITLLAQDYGKRNSSIKGAYTSLISTFERTPIGSDLRLGEIRKDGATRRIFKRGGYPFLPAVVLYALYKYAERAGQYRISLEQIAASPFSPHRLLAVDAEYVKRSLLSLFALDLLTVNVQDDTVMFLLNSEKHSLNVIEMLMS